MNCYSRILTYVRIYTFTGNISTGNEKFLILTGVRKRAANEEVMSRTQYTTMLVCCLKYVDSHKHFDLLARNSLPDQKMFFKAARMEN